MDNTILNIISVFVGGGLGAILRWITCSKIPYHWGTFVVNILGAFLIGALYQYIATHSSFKPEMKLFLMTGLLGGFTTFSTYMLDFITLIQANHLTEAIIYLITSICVGVLFLLLGIRIISLIF